MSVCDRTDRIDLIWHTMDGGVITKAPLGGIKYRIVSLTLAKVNQVLTKRSILVEGKGDPISVSVDGTNRHDMKMSKGTLQCIAIYTPEPTIR